MRFARSLLLALAATGCGVVETPSPTAPAVAATTPVAATAASAGAIEGKTWVLDFARSGLLDAVPGCPQCSLGSALTFRQGELTGGTGAGGGCDTIVGTYLIAGSSLRLAIQPERDPCYPGSSVPEIRARLGRVALFALSGCTTDTCDVLVLMATGGKVLLLYNLSP